MQVQNEICTKDIIKNNQAETGAEDLSDSCGKRHAEHTKGTSGKWCVCGRGRCFEITQLENKQKSIRKSEESLCDLWDSMKRANSGLNGVSEGEEREKGAENLFTEIIAENFPNRGRELDIPVSEANRSSYYLNAKRLSERHIMKIAKKIKDKES